MIALLLAASVAAAPPARPVGGEAVFKARCALCHEAPGGPGVVMLERRLGKEKAHLSQRTDLQPAYVKLIVRRGLGSMPAISRAEVTDAELDQLAAYLTRSRS